MADRKLKAVGITCGIGSMLVGARQAGFDVAGNVEWRGYYHFRDRDGRNTFGENFPGAIFKKHLDDLTPTELRVIEGADLVLGHPECGNFSILSGANVAAGRDLRKDPSDIPLFVDLIARVRPRFFAMDDLPRSFTAFPMQEYHRRLAEYDLYPEWVSNWGYGNVQKNRNRMFMVGALRGQGFAFRPGEDHNPLKTADILSQVEGLPNHLPHCRTGNSPRARCAALPDRYWTWAEVAARFMAHPSGWSWTYEKPDGTNGVRIGFLRTHWDGPCHVLTGQNAICHPLTGFPLTIRERAKIQGFPDDFVFYSEKVNDQGEWTHEDNLPMVRQTGKAMPVQFCRYLSGQVSAHVLGRSFGSTGLRVIRPNEHVDSAKKWYCENVGYSDQDKACSCCWMHDRCTIRMRKYGIGEPEIGQRDLYDPGVVPPEDKPRSRKPRIYGKDKGTRSEKPSTVQFPVVAPGVPVRDLEFGG